MLRAHGCARAVFDEGCAYTLKAMEGREGCLHKDVLMLRAHECARAVFNRGRAYTLKATQSHISRTKAND